MYTIVLENIHTKVGSYHQTCSFLHVISKKVKRYNQGYY